MLNEELTPEAHRIRYHIEKMDVDAPNATNHKEVNANLQAELDRALDAFLNSLQDKIKSVLERSDVIIIPEISIRTQARDAKGIAKDMVATFEKEFWKRVDNDALAPPLDSAPREQIMQDAMVAAEQRESEENLARFERIYKKMTDGAAKKELNPLTSFLQLVARIGGGGVSVPATDADGGAGGLTPIADVKTGATGPVPQLTPVADTRGAEVKQEPSTAATPPATANAGGSAGAPSPLAATGGTGGAPALTPVAQMPPAATTPNAKTQPYSALDRLQEQHRGVPQITPPVGGKARIEYPSSTVFPPLSKDPAVYADLVAKYPHAKSMTYHADSVALVRGAREDILKAAKETGVPPEAIAGAMLDENTKIRGRYLGLVDAGQDWLTGTLAFKPESALSYDHLKNYVDSTPVDKRIRDSLTNPSMWDVGPYNINAALGLELFQKYVLDPKASNSLKRLTLEGLSPKSSPQDKWQKFVERCLLDPKGGAYVAAIVMRDGAKELKASMQGAGPEEKAALLVTYFKQGPETMQRLYARRVKETGDTSYIKPGEGAIIFHNMGTLRSILDQ